MKIYGCLVCLFFLKKKIVDENDYYRKRTQTLIPLKWMSPETIKDARYTHKSDVWAFGVLGFEVMSFGMTPYGALGGQELMTELERGYRLPQPPACPPSLYEAGLSYIVRKCLMAFLQVYSATNVLVNGPGRPPVI